MPSSMMTRDYYERFNWAPRPLKCDMYYDTPQINVTLANTPGKTKKHSAIFPAETKEQHTHLGGWLTRIAIAM